MNEPSVTTVSGKDLTIIKLEQIATTADEIQKHQMPKWQMVVYDDKCFIYDADKLTTSLF